MGIVHIPKAKDFEIVELSTIGTLRTSDEIAISRDFGDGAVTAKYWKFAYFLSVEGSAAAADNRCREIQLREFPDVSSDLPALENFSSEGWSDPENMFDSDIGSYAQGLGTMPPTGRTLTLEFAVPITVRGFAIYYMKASGKPLRWSPGKFTLYSSTDGAVWDIFVDVDFNIDPPELGDYNSYGVFLPKTGIQQLRAPLSSVIDMVE